MEERLQATTANLMQALMEKSGEIEELKSSLKDLSKEKEVLSKEKEQKSDLTANLMQALMEKGAEVAESKRELEEEKERAGEMIARLTRSREKAVEELGKPLLEKVPLF